MKKRPVIVGLGEVLWDVYPDAEHFGGAPANFACHAASLGAEAWMVSAVGTDDLGARAVAALREHHVEVGALTRDSGHPTGTVRVWPGEAGHVRYEIITGTAWDHVEWSDALGALAERCDVVCFGTLGQRSPVSRQTIRCFVEATSAIAWRVFDVNLRQHFYDEETIRASLAMASMLKLNDEELPVVADLCGVPAAPPPVIMEELARRFHLRVVALTCGARGSLLFADGIHDTCPAQPTTMVDPVGAGDAFTAALVTSLFRGESLPVAHRHANAVAAFVCSQKGATPALPPELCRFQSNEHQSVP